MSRTRPKVVLSGRRSNQSNRRSESGLVSARSLVGDYNLGVERSPRLEIEYCTQCRWLPRASWVAQELLTTFVDDLGELALVPGKGGVFDVRLDGETIWSRKEAGRFPETSELKQLVRDRIDPDRNLGHSDRRPESDES